MSALPAAEAYQDFLKAKVKIAQSVGFAVDRSDINPLLIRHQPDIVARTVSAGFQGVFTSYGLGKTPMNLESQRLTLKYANADYGLIALPLGVRKEFFNDAKMLVNGNRDNISDAQRRELADWLDEHYGDTDPYKLRFIQTNSEIDAPGIYLTNYESIREEKIDPSRFKVLSLDEGDVLRSFGSATFSEFLFGPAMQVPYKYVFTATPSPNDLIELLSYAQFLGVMDIGEAKTRFFKRNAEKADDLTLFPGREREFWLWVSTWAIFVQKPSDLGYSDEGYQFPPLKVNWHEIPTNHSVDVEPTKKGQRRLFKDTTKGITEASREKRVSIPGRVAKALEIRANDPEHHRLYWLDLEEERKAIEAAIPGIASVFGKQKLTEREKLLTSFADGEIAELATKPSIAGSGGNYQRHCARATYLGVGFKFRDFIQSLHRILRFLQPEQVEIDIIFTEAEREVVAEMLRKWRLHDELAATMAQIIRDYGLGHLAIAGAMHRSLGLKREVHEGPNHCLVLNDTVEETAAMDSNSVGFICTSIPFSNQYQYTPSLNDFGHTEGLEHFMEQMGFLTPQLLRVLKPGRVMALHVKDRAVPGAMIGQSYMTIEPFHADVIQHCRKHGFRYLGMKVIVTDVVRENNQTYRLGHTEECKDSSKMGAGLPEYLLIFRKDPSNPGRGYADEPVTKTREAMPLSRWQLEAHALWRSGGDRLLTAEDFDHLSLKYIYRKYRGFSYANEYDHGQVLDIAAGLAGRGKLRQDFMVMPPQSWNPEVWTDIMRARTLNSLQAGRGREKHICPLQIDIVERAIYQWSNPDDVVFDPFNGVGTVTKVAIEMGRYGRGHELNRDYWLDSVHYAHAAEEKKSVPTLFDLNEISAIEEEGVPKEAS